MHKLTLKIMKHSIPIIFIIIIFPLYVVKTMGSMEMNWGLQHYQSVPVEDF